MHAAASEVLIIDKMTTDCYKIPNLIKVEQKKQSRKSTWDSLLIPENSGSVDNGDPLQDG